MPSLRQAYGALIRAPLIGPFARLPLRLLRALLQSPDRDPSTRIDLLSTQIRALEGRLGELNAAHETLMRDHERARLILFMLSGQLRSEDADALPGLDPLAVRRRSSLP